jgi:carboxylate-amine ligase
LQLRAGGARGTGPITPDGCHGCRETRTCHGRRSTHPFAETAELKFTAKERYEKLGNDLQGVVRGMAISGMHVHVAVEDEDLRIDLMRQVNYLLPHLLALSTSSPFWQREDTGLKFYRMASWDQMPRTGLPEQFDSYSAYRKHVGVLVDAGVIEDATKVWWDIRPSERYPTLEMRISDICTRLDDGITIAALYVC